MKEKKQFRNPWAWIPTLYFAEGLPYIVVMSVSVIMYKSLGISNTDIALYTSWLYLPWVIKPLWSPIVDILKTKRYWIVLMQFFVGVGLAGVALTIPVSNFFQYTLAFFWLLAFSSATHDISADGFYMLGLNEHDQAWFVGIRNTFYRIAFITGQGLLVILAGYVQSHSGLQTVGINVFSNPSKNIEQFVNPKEVKFNIESSNLVILHKPSNLNISTKHRSKKEVDSIFTFAKNWNEKNGFYQNKTSEKEINNESEAPSWWEKNITLKLEDFLKNNFGKEKQTSLLKDSTGNIGIIYFRLSKEPEGKVVVNFGRESGDNSFSLVEGSRLIFNKSNWNKPAIAVVQLDPKLNFISSAFFQAKAGNIPLAWIVTFIVLTALFVFFVIYHKFMLPYPASDKPTVDLSSQNVLKEFFNTFLLFFKKEKIGIILAFLLLYRFGEAQLVKIASPFLLDTHEAGGLALTLGQVGFVYGTVGIIALTLGGILGGFLAAKQGLKYWMWWMIAAINIPDIVYVYLSYTHSVNFFIINIMVALEQFGYGFGFTAYALFLIYVAKGEHKTSHYAIATGFMALGMMIPGMFSGWLQELIGYQHYFIWVCISTIPAFIITFFIPLDNDFGKKQTVK